LRFVVYFFIIPPMTTLNAKLRDNATKNEVLRSEGKIPAVFYGFNREVTSLVVNKVDFTKAFREVGETNTLTLETPSGKFDALIHEVQYDPIKDQPIHVDFLSVDMNKEVEVDVPLEFIGESAAVKAGGILVKVMYEINIVSLPSKVPHKIEVDISSLTANDSVITLKDVNFPEGVKFTEEVDAVVAAISVGKDEVEETTEAPDLSSIEVEAKGKKEVEGESTEEGK
jgi:large subunit ribosomal protein L25